MNITIVGSGYVGLVTGACLAELNHSVTCVDNDARKLEQLKRGEIPFFEPGLDDLVTRNVANGRLQFCSRISLAMPRSEVVFIAVGTPADSSGDADLSYVYGVAQEIGQSMSRPLLVVNKSTVPVGTAEAVRYIIESELATRQVEIRFDVASNPEFLKEGNAIQDFMHPDRVVIGAGCQTSQDILKKVYAPLGESLHTLHTVDIRDAEMIKYAANTMLATKISLMNEIAVMCDELDVDVEMVKQGIATDSRIGPSFINPGCGYGGSCFPKDVRAMRAMARESGVSGKIFEAVHARNLEQQHVLADRIVNFYGEELAHKTIAVWGLSFKPGTDDIREAPAITIINRLLDAGATLRVYDPKAIDNARAAIDSKQVFFCHSAAEAVKEADALLVTTEWEEFKAPDIGALGTSLADQVIFDGRNLFDPTRLESLGIAYCGIGRRNRLFTLVSGRTNGARSSWALTTEMAQGRPIDNIPVLEEYRPRANHRF